ncbi:MAG: hypothetical protein KDA44_03805 [Planctomycetales bacterium]|nr:hypothetical protein [Planctomycetales bacterium]
MPTPCESIPRFLTEAIPPRIAPARQAAAHELLVAEWAVWSLPDNRALFARLHELSDACRKHDWPCWSVDRGASWLTIHLLGFGLPEPIENRLRFNRAMAGENLGEIVWQMKTIPDCVASIQAALVRLGLDHHIQVEPAHGWESAPWHMERLAGTTGVEIDWSRQPTDWPSLWDPVAAPLRTPLYQLDHPGVSAAAQAWRPGSLRQFAVVTAAARRADRAGRNVIDWAAENECRLSPLAPYVRTTGGLLLFAEQIVTALHELGGLDWQHAVECIAPDAVETRFREREPHVLESLRRQGHAAETAWRTCDALRAAAADCDSLAVHLTNAVLTYRMLWFGGQLPSVFQQGLERSARSDSR